MTGGAGYVGSVLTVRLLGGGYQVRVVDSLVSYGGGPAPRFPAGTEFVRGDVRDFRLMTRAVDGCDAVVHLAAVVGYPACAADPSEARSTNIDGTVTVLRAASGRQVVFASSMSCLGDVAGGICDEDVTPRPTSLYGVTKLTGERLVLDQPNTVVLRPATAFGLSPRMRMDLLVHQLVSDAVQTGAITLYEPGYVRCFGHVEDFASSIVHAISRPDAMCGEIFHVGNGELNMTKRELAEAISQIVPCDIAVAASGKDQDQRNYGATFSKLAGAGFSFKRGIDVGINEVLAFLNAEPSGLQRI
ncbi:MAG TPA: NAD(P)-dependent oxidoreductase [Mycobacteriales bacterium]|nr:NAD(P)-dependent oxidoreductase [Mycobacteriales bacterium]